MSRVSIILIMLVVLTALTGCEKEKIVEVPVESPVQVSIEATPNTVDTGGQVTLVATVTAPDPSAISLSWEAPSGSFSDSSADTTSWTAPDDEGVVTVSVTATDQSNAGVGNANITVSSYTPTDTPSYVGAETCSGCHGDIHTAWNASGHAGAWEALVEYGVDGNPYCQQCHTVGFKGLNADPALENGGFHNTAVERLQNVQCENCHSAGSEHPSPNFTSVEASMFASICGSCHTDAHHPTFDEWLTSAHADSVGYAAGRASCAKCHNGLVAHEYLDDPVNFTNPSEDPTETLAHHCSVCHDPHGNDNPGNLRDASVTDVSLPNGVLVEAAGAGRLCMSCHNGRRTDTDVEDQIQNGSDHFGPHHSIQGDMLAGVNAYNDVNPAWEFATSRHIQIQDACVTCHTHPNEGDPNAGIPNFTGHTFEPTVEACAACHGPVTEFSDIPAKEDYDGNGEVEGVQDEVEGLLALLQTAVIAASTSQEAIDALTADFEEAIGDATLTTVDQRKAGYNWAYVDFDGSHGVHNATYSIQLLQQSIQFVSPGALPARAVILVED